MTPTTVYGWPSRRMSLPIALRVAAELRLPQRVAQHHLLLVAELAFLFREGAAQRRRDAQQPEERRRRLRHADARRRAVLIDAVVAAVVQRLLFEDVGTSRSRS